MDNSSHSSIMVVDDDIFDLDVLSNILKPSYVIYPVKSGRAAIKGVKENKPDIILLDIMMPDMSGFEVLSELKESKSTRHIPVIFITGLCNVEDEEKGLCLGAVDYIRKPFYSSIVKARIRAHLKNSKQNHTKNEKFLILKTRKEVHNVLFRELLYVDVLGHWLNFHLASGDTVEVYASLEKYKDVLLVDPRFACCHKSFILNMDFVEAVEVQNVLMKNKVRLPISRKHKSFKTQYINWVSGGGS